MTKRLRSAILFAVFLFGGVVCSPVLQQAVRAQAGGPASGAIQLALRRFLATANTWTGVQTYASGTLLQSVTSVASFGAELSPDNVGAVCSGNGVCVTKSVAVVSGTDYLVSWTQNHDTANNGTVTPGIDAATGVGVSQRLIGGIAERVVVQALTTGTVNLTFTVSGYSAGNITLSLISLKAVVPSTYAVTLQNSNSSVGVDLRSGGSGKSNTFVGYQAGQDTPNGFSAAFGYQALAKDTSGQFDSAFGYQALLNNTNGGHNSAFGYQALMSNTGAASNSAFGDTALSLVTTGGFNDAFGNNALGVLTTGRFNAAFGFGALGAVTIGEQNMGIGTNALAHVVTGGQNTAVGYNAGTNTTGSTNTCIGYLACANSTAGSNLILIGDNIQPISNTSTSGEINIGGAILQNRTAPTIASGGCTSPAVTWTNGTGSFLLTLGSSCAGVKTIVLTLPATIHLWHVVCDNNTSDTQQKANYVVGLATSPTAVTLTNFTRTTGVTGDFTAADTLLCSASGG